MSYFFLCNLNNAYSSTKFLDNQSVLIMSFSRSFILKYKFPLSNVIRNND